MMEDQQHHVAAAASITSLLPSHGRREKEEVRERTRKSTSTTTTTTTGGSYNSLLFPMKLHKMLNDVKEKEENQDIVSWLPNGKAFKIHDKEKFINTILPVYFGSSARYRTFQRNLNLWCFETPSHGPHQGVTSHPLFQEGRIDLCNKMKRMVRKNSIKLAMTIPEESALESSSSARRPPLQKGEKGHQETALSTVLSPCSHYHDDKTSSSIPMDIAKRGATIRNSNIARMDSTPVNKNKNDQHNDYGDNQQHRLYSLFAEKRTAKNDSQQQHRHHQAEQHCHQDHGGRATSAAFSDSKQFFADVKNAIAHDDSTIHHQRNDRMNTPALPEALRRNNFRSSSSPVSDILDSITPVLLEAMFPGTTSSTSHTTTSQQQQQQLHTSSSSPPFFSYFENIHSERLNRRENHAENINGRHFLLNANDVYQEPLPSIQRLLLSLPHSLFAQPSLQRYPNNSMNNTNTNADSAALLVENIARLLREHDFEQRIQELGRRDSTNEHQMSLLRTAEEEKEEIEKYKYRYYIHQQQQVLQQKLHLRNELEMIKILQQVIFSQQL